jgi:hypothetical protein
VLSLLSVAKPPKRNDEVSICALVVKVEDKDERYELLDRFMSLTKMICASSQI